MDERWFIDGERFEMTFHTPGGWLAIGCDVKVSGFELQLSEVEVYPIEQPKIAVGVSTLLNVRREFMERAHQEGYTSIVITAWRVSGVNPFRSLRLQGRL